MVGLIAARATLLTPTVFSRALVDPTACTQPTPTATFVKKIEHGVSRSRAAQVSKRSSFRRKIINQSQVLLKAEDLWAKK